jgi:hypothetical protein
MPNAGSHALIAALVRMLRPLVKILLHRGVSFKTLSDLLKWLYADVAAEEFGPAGRKLSISRVSAMTGMTRKEVARLLEHDKPQDRKSSERFNRAARVIAGWRRDPDFKDGRGAAAGLEFKGDGPSFTELVRRYSGDMTPRAMLDELLRVGAAKQLRDGRIKLAVRGYVPEGGDELKIHILGTDVGHLIATIAHNLNSGPTPESRPFFQRKVFYDNLPIEALAEFRALSAENSQRLLEKLDLLLSKKDRDVNPSVEGNGRWVAGVGIYYFEEPYKKE